VITYQTVSTFFAGGDPVPLEFGPQVTHLQREGCAFYVSYGSAVQSTLADLLAYNFRHANFKTTLFWLVCVEVRIFKISDKK